MRRCAYLEPNFVKQILAMAAERLVNTELGLYCKFLSSVFDLDICLQSLSVLQHTEKNYKQPQQEPQPSSCRYTAR